MCHWWKRLLLPPRSVTVCLGTTHFIFAGEWVNRVWSVQLPPHCRGVLAGMPCGESQLSGVWRSCNRSTCCLELSCVSLNLLVQLCLHTYIYASIHLYKHTNMHTGDQGVSLLRRMALLDNLIAVCLKMCLWPEGAVLSNDPVSLSVLPADCCVLGSCHAAFKVAEFSEPRPPYIIFYSLVDA